jgi:superfamily II DNA or RNA helicase/HKD family nuclease
VDAEGVLREAVHRELVRGRRHAVDDAILVDSCPCPLPSPRVRAFPPGLYDLLLTASRAEDLATLGDAARLEPPDAPLAAQLLARLVHDRLVEVLKGLHGEKDPDRVAAQVDLTNRVLALVEAANTSDAADAVLSPALRLVAVLDTSRGTLAAREPPVAPAIPLTLSDLLVNGRHDLRLGSEVVRELASADSVDLLCSFLKWSGLVKVEAPLKAVIARGRGRVRVLTTAYMGATERRALDALADMGAEVHVSYDTERTRLHAKAWLFHRESGFSTGFIGSSNLSAAAMHDGVEWNVRVARADNGGILEKFAAVFAQYWADERTFEPYVPARDAARFDRAVQAERTGSAAPAFAMLEVTARPHQQEILDRLEAERLKGHTRNLVVAATGTGKTVVAALDYERLEASLGPRPRLLFVAHRHEILEQSRAIYRAVLRDRDFGERLGGGAEPITGAHVFANVQSLDEARIATLGPSAYDVVVVDEFHHAAAPTYARLLERLRPKLLLGLTATPERADGQSVLAWFDDRIAAELRLWKALDQDLLCPFQYFGVRDGTNLAQVKWTPTGYAAEELRRIYTAGDAWLRLVLGAVRHYVTEPTRMRALGFCVDVDRAEFMAMRFTEAGLPSLAVTQRTPPAARAAALADLRDGRVRALFSVDLFNEGVDLPDVDTLFLLRPTESATVFLQQLGRGLRRARGKACVTVLDFIGLQHRRFRFDARFRALLGGTRRQIERDIEAGFPHLPSGCSIQLDKEAQEAVLANLRDAVGKGDEVLVADLKELGPGTTLAAFLRRAQRDLEDVYKKPGWSWSSLRRHAGHLDGASSKEEDAFARALARCLHVDDPLRLSRFQELLAGAAPPVADPADPAQRLLFVLLGRAREPLARLSDAWRALWDAPALRAELRELLAILDDRRGLTHPLEGRLRDLPLRVHATYALDEVTAALGEVDKHGGVRRLREGVLWSEQHRVDLLFVTLDKREEDYSPTTLYQDYPISPTRFHWESQSTVHEGMKVGQRYVHHAARGSEVWLFVRRAKHARPDITAPYTFVGPCSYVRHQGGRPMAIEWQLARAMPAWLYQETKLAAG